MPRAAIVAGVRSPIGKAGRAYKDLHPVDLLTASLVGALGASGLDDPALIDQVLVGCVVQSGEQGANIGRNAWLAGGLPISVPATTLDTQCGSSQQAVNLAAALVNSGHADLILAGGVEHTSRVGAPDVEDATLPQPYSREQLDRYDMPGPGTAGERMARKYNITRAASDEYGLRSHLLAHEGWSQGHFEHEIVFIERDGEPILERDQGIRADSTAERLAQLPPVYQDDGVITAASASQLSDGSAAIIVASEDAVSRHGLEPLAWIKATATVGVDPEIMLEGPIAATTTLLEKSNLTLDDVDLFEVHEAYAVVACAWRDVHAVELERINVDGGAIALGHPFGASGARQIAHLVHSLRRTGGRLGVQVMCCGGGIGTGTVLECT